MAAKSGQDSFHIYVSPVGFVYTRATKVIMGFNDSLKYDGVSVRSVPIRNALVAFLTWLKKFGEKCCIAVHNLTFCGPRLMRFIEYCSLTEDFKAAVLGFVDTLAVIRSKNNGQSCSLTALATANMISINGAHNAINDCKMLSEILRKMDISDADLLKNMKVFEECRGHWAALQLRKIVRTKLTPLSTAVPYSVLRRIANAGITFSILTDVYENTGEDGLRQMIISHDSLKSLEKRSIENIISYFTKKTVTNDKGVKCFLDEFLIFKKNVQ